MSEILYEAKLNVTGATEFGIGLEPIMHGNIPAGGARFDIAFAGSLNGQVNGRLEGVDHLYVRADGKMELNLRGVVTLDDGRKVAFRGVGVGRLRPNSPLLDFEEGPVELFSSHEDLVWMNTRYFRGHGSANLGTGEIEVTVFA